MVKAKLMGRFLSPCLRLGVAVLLCFGAACFVTRPAWCAGEQGRVPLTLAHTIEVGLHNNEDIQESFHRISASQASVTSSEGAYDVTLFGTGRYGSFDALSSSDYSASGLTNAAKSYGRVDAGARVHVATGGTVSLYNTYSHEKRLGINSQARNRQKSYVTIQFVQSLLRGIGDKETRGAVETAMLAVQDSQESRNLVVSQVVLSIVRAYWTLDSSRYNVDVAQQVLDLAREVHRRENVRYKQGLSQGVDVERAQQAVKAREYALLQYRRDMALAREQLALLLNYPGYTSDTLLLPVSKPNEVVGAVPDVQPSIVTALGKRYELKQLDILLKQLNIEYEVNSNKLLPTLDASIGGTTTNGNDNLQSAENFSDTDDEASWFAGLSFSFPLQNREAEGDLERTEMLQRIAKNRIRKTCRSIETDIRNALHNLTLASKGIPVARAARDAARQTKLGEDKRFELGGVNNIDLLSAQDLLGREEMNLYAAIVNYNIAQAEYKYACGTLLEDLNIKVTEDEASIL